MYSPLGQQTVLIRKSSNFSKNSTKSRMKIKNSKPKTQKLFWDFKENPTKINVNRQISHPKTQKDYKNPAIKKIPRNLKNPSIKQHPASYST